MKVFDQQHHISPNLIMPNQSNLNDYIISLIYVKPINEP